MRKFLSVSLVFIVILAIFYPYTNKERVDNYGGTRIVYVESGYKVTSATWKSGNLFYMVEKMDSSYVPTEKILIGNAMLSNRKTKVKFIESR